MVFEPESDDHAILEVVFAVTFAQDFSTAQLDTLAKEHDRWKAELPKLGRSGRLQFVFGQDAPPSEIQLPGAVGVSFDRIKPDGTLEWRLRADNRTLYVNCLAYTGWEAVWPRAFAYLLGAAEVLSLDSNQVKNVLLQYINVFNWESSPNEYSARELLRSDSILVPPGVLDRGSLWHLHQGWFRTDNLPADGRILERVNIDGIEEQSGLPVVKIDTYMQLQLASGLPTEVFFGADGDRIFNVLHDQTKTLLSGFLTEDVAKRIGLFDASN